MTAVEALNAARAVGIRLETDGDSLVLEAEYAAPPQVLDMLRAHKPEVLGLLCDERRAVIMWINDHFQSSPLGQCIHCGRGSRKNDPFVALFVGDDSADIHASCHPEWIIEREAEARIALDIETPKQRRIDK